MNAETTGSLIAKIREERKMTQAQLAELVHVKRSCRSEGKRHRRGCAGYLPVHTSCRLFSEQDLYRLCGHRCLQVEEYR